MSYAINADVQERLGSLLYVQLTDDTGTGSADEDKVTEGREAAEGEVNSYLGRRYAVPVDVSTHSELAALLKSITLDVTEQRLHSRRPPVPAAVQQRLEAAVRWLERVAAGTVVLPAATEPAGNDATGVSGEVTGATRVMSRDTLEDL